MRMAEIDMRIHGKRLSKIKIDGENYIIFLSTSLPPYIGFGLVIGPLDIKGKIEELVAKKIADKYGVRLRDWDFSADLDQSDWQKVFVIRLSTKNENWKEYALEKTKAIKEEIEKAKNTLTEAVKELHQVLNKAAEFITGLK
jgi:hypothetical protein